MPEETDLVEALEALDTAALEAVADQTGYGLRTLWRYRGGAEIPPARRRVLERKLGLAAGRPIQEERDD